MKNPIYLIRQNINIAAYNSTSTEILNIVFPSVIEAETYLKDQGFTIEKTKGYISMTNSPYAKPLNKTYHAPHNKNMHYDILITHLN